MDIGLGLQTTTQSAWVDGPSGASPLTIDVDIPVGKVVISSGIQLPDGFGSHYMAADGPHPTDATKWRFQASVNDGTGGWGYSMTILCWMLVVNAAS